MMIYKKFYKNTKMRKMFLRTGFVELFVERVFIEGKILTINYTKRVTQSSQQDSSLQGRIPLLYCQDQKKVNRKIKTI